MAGLMSGLTLGLMSLDEVDLEVLKRSGTTKQKACAARILPVIANPHRLLVTLLVCNAVAAEALPLVLDRLTDPITAVVLSVTVVLLFGEIIPQAACSAYGLEIGAHSAIFVKILMFLTSPLVIPIAWVLDKILGHRQTALFRRAELKALMDIHDEGQDFGGQLSSDEVRIIKGALDLTNKRAKAAMTPLDMVFMLPLDATLDEGTLTGILASGHSRIPVHQPGNRGEILGILLTKELILVDIHAGIKVSSMKVRSLPHLLAETPMYDMLKLFELGRSHMAVLTQPTKAALHRLKQEAHSVAIDVYDMSDDEFGSDEDTEREYQAQRRRGFSSSDSTDVDEDADGPGVDVFSISFQHDELQPTGIITIEDVIEELLGAEIVDETDNFVDNLAQTRVNAAALARALPPHLRKALNTWTFTPRVGNALHIYKMANADRERRLSGDAVVDRVGSRPFLNGNEIPPFTNRFANLPRKLQPSGIRGRSHSEGGNLHTAGFRSARLPERRTTNFAQGVQDQLALLQPLLEARREKYTVLEGVDEETGLDLLAEELGSLRRENSI